MEARSNAHFAARIINAADNKIVPPIRDDGRHLRLLRVAGIVIAADHVVPRRRLRRIAGLAEEQGRIPCRAERMGVDQFAIRYRESNHHIPAIIRAGNVEDVIGIAGVDNQVDTAR